MNFSYNKNKLPFLLNDKYFSLRSIFKKIMINKFEKPEVFINAVTFVD